jgi:hypothetical protein
LVVGASGGCDHLQRGGDFGHGFLARPTERRPPCSQRREGLGHILELDFAVIAGDRDHVEHFRELFGRDLEVGHRGESCLVHILDICAGCRARLRDRGHGGPSLAAVEARCHQAGERAHQIGGRVARGHRKTLQLLPDVLLLPF